MATGYSEDLRLAAIRCVEQGKSRADVVVFFGISLKTLSNWLKRYREEGHISARRPGRYPPRVVCRDRLASLVAKRPDATLAELAIPFGTHPSVIDYHLRKMGITRKKNSTLRRERRRKATRLSGGA